MVDSGASADAPLAHPLIAIVGATGAVGREALGLLAERGHPVDRVWATASTASVGLKLPFGENSIEVRLTDLQQLAAADLVVLATATEVARDLAPGLVRAGCRVVDNSAAFRMDPAVPLVVPEVNGALVRSGTGLVANPNCSTILLLVALEPLRRAFGIGEVVVSTYQAVSGAGQRAMDELEAQTRAVLSGQPPVDDVERVFREPCAFNVFAHDSPVDLATGRNGEEHKMARETARIWGDEEASMLATCVRVPVLRSHCQSVLVTLRTPATEEDVRAALSEGAGLEVLDDRHAGVFPTALRATGRDAVLVGRLRAVPAGRGDGATTRFMLWLAGDQLRKGAALNALQVGDLLLARDA